MKPSKLLGNAIVATIALASITASTAASTLPNILPQGSGVTAVTGQSSSGKSTIGTGVLELESATSEGSFESTQPKLGNFDRLYLKVQTAISPHALCTGLADDVSGSVLMKGTYHIRDFEENGTLLTGLIILLRPVHIWCEDIPNFLDILTGCVAGALTPETRLTKTLTVTSAKNGSKNENLIITVLNEENSTKELCELLGSENGGASKRIGIVTTQALTGFKQSGAEVEVLVMRL